MKQPINEEFFTIVKRCGNSAHIAVSKLWIGKRVKISIKEEEEKKKNA